MGLNLSTSTSYTLAVSCRIIIVDNSTIHLSSFEYVVILSNSLSVSTSQSSQMQKVNNIINKV